MSRESLLRFLNVSKSNPPSNQEPLAPVWVVNMAERLRRETRNLMGSPAQVQILLLTRYFFLLSKKNSERAILNM